MSDGGLADGGHVSCQSCGSKIEFAKEEPPCKALAGWYMVAHWLAVESVDHHGFCSATCLQRWVSTQVPEIPRAFLESLEDEAME